ncbi:ABC-type transport system involved in cytochrome bd biosynthesis, ATPase and permease component [Tritrichomonas foetus]|uniref:ABC-type transport system involved in cytochrome bd biosynthesis, ATPase and permease component n=1 Tax=Tritrichomonas foetus TaxID=1144522 RepID=A0A1J4JG10_9EUKA|nr:ABC-type transport system involved in cytochrome bd biosynthesis, ATPase and permease component [Tritrichomonas foetus]|eukprot:OHS96579.1 ABC-type transport system involved in cytochrome bd biosynthesis, ATPase and permease component [Tritrichomonas foetus]
MINTKLLDLVSDSKKFIFGCVLCNWIAMIFQIFSTHWISSLLNEAINKKVPTPLILQTALMVAISIGIRFVCDVLWNYFSYRSSRNVKKNLRVLIYNKLLKLGVSYNEQIATAEIVQITAEGVEQLEMYFGRYLPQFFYAMVAPITLFIAFSYTSIRTASVLLFCVPLIPIAIIAVSKYAKRVIGKYWGVYLNLGDSFLENVQGLTTLKIYQSDEYKNRIMNEKAETFRKITMKVLFMQLSSIVIMDLVAYGGAGAGIITSIFEFKNGRVDFRGCFEMMMLAAEFFLPLRALGSSFHVSMNGVSAANKIFRLLGLPESGEKPIKLTPENINNSKENSISLEHVDFNYEENRQVLHSVDLEIPSGQFVSIVGESGCGKSTIAQLIAGINKNYKNGSIKIYGNEINQIDELTLMSSITTVNHNSYIFKGTVRYNLKIAKQDATDEEFYNVLKEVNLYDFVKSQQGLDTPIEERGSNLSGGQCQRLAIARALLANSSIYIFDEATSNIDVESEEAIMKVIHKIAESKKTVLLISHRLANVVKSDRIYVMESGKVVGCGKHEELMKNNDVYNKLYTSQFNLENGIH